MEILGLLSHVQDGWMDEMTDSTQIANEAVYYIDSNRVTLKTRMHSDEEKCTKL